MNGTEMIDRVAADLFDKGHERWLRAMVAKYVTWAQDWVVSMRPDVHSEHETVSLAGGTEQSLANLVTDGWRVIRGVRNSGGDTIKTVTKQELDQFLPDDWVTMTGTPYYVGVDRESHDRFWVWPGASAGDSVVIVVAKRPTEVTTANESSEMDLGPQLREPIADMAVSFALRRNAAENSSQQADVFAQRAAATLSRVLPLPGSNQGVQA